MHVRLWLLALWAEAWWERLELMNSFHIAVTAVACYERRLPVWRHYHNSGAAVAAESLFTGIHDMSLYKHISMPSVGSSGTIALSGDAKWEFYSQCT